MNKLILPLFAIFLISSVLALSITAGNSYTWDFSNQADKITNISVQVVNNTYNLDGLNFNISIPYVTMTTDYNYKADNFTILFLINGEKHISSGGSGGGNYISPKNYDNYTCGEWSICTEIGQTRTCVKNGKSETQITLPTWRSCNYTNPKNETKTEPIDDKEINIPIKNSDYLIYLIVIISLLAIVGGIILFAKHLQKRKKEENKNE